MSVRVIMAMVGLRLGSVVRDPALLVWLLGMPLLFSFLMGQLLGDWSGGGAAERPRFMVYAKEPGPAVDHLLHGLRDNERFLMVRPDSAATRTSVASAVEDGRITAGLFVPRNFAGAVDGGDTATLQLYFDSDRLSSQTIRTLLDDALLRLNTAAAARSLVEVNPDGTPPRGRASAFDEERFNSLWEEPRVRLLVSTLGRAASDDEFPLTSSYQHVGPSYILFFAMMFLLTVSAKELVTERQDRTLARLVVSRASSADLVLGFLGGGLVLGLVQITVLLVLNSLIFGLDYGDSPLALMLVAVLFAVVCSAASVLLGTLARTGPQADGLGVAITMLLAALGGLWWPLEVVPAFMQNIGQALPTGQAITVFHNLIGRGWGVAENAELLMGLAAWGAVLLVLAAVRLRRSLSA